MTKIPPTIFLAEDEDFVAKAYIFFLKKEEFNVVSVKKGDEVVLRILELQPKPDIILMDLVMPGVDGFENLKILKSNEQTKNIPVLVISNLSQQSEIDRCMKLGAVDYVIKSNSSAQDLIEKIKTILNCK